MKQMTGFLRTEIANKEFQENGFTDRGNVLIVTLEKSCLSRRWLIGRGKQRRSKQYTCLFCLEDFQEVEKFNILQGNLI